MNPKAYEEMARVQDTHWWYVARRAILRSVLTTLRLPPDADILEIGCGTGANLPVLGEFARVVGFEMSAQAIGHALRTANGRGDISLVEGRCPQDLARLTQRFDLICLLDVLEHLDQDANCLARLRPLLKPNGKVLIMVPAYRWMWGPHDVYHHHRRRYDRRSLALACDHGGFDVRRMCHFNTVLFPLAVLGRMYEKLTGLRSAATQLPAAPLNRLLTLVFAWERRLIARWSVPVGLSLLAVAAPRS